MGTTNLEFITWLTFTISMALFVIHEYRVAFFKDFTLPFSASGRTLIRKERYMLHFLCSGAFAVLAAILSILFGIFAGAHWYETMVPAILAGFTGNALVEWYRQKRAGKENDDITWKVPFSYRDCRYGAYGFTLIFIIINLIRK